jgi:hypothetical protein
MWQVEVAAMLFRDELEEGGALERPDLEAAVAERRAELLAEAERDLARRAAKAEANGGRSERERERDRDKDRERHSRCPRQHLYSPPLPSALPCRHVHRLWVFCMSLCPPQVKVLRSQGCKLGGSMGSKACSTP